MTRPVSIVPTQVGVLALHGVGEHGPGWSVRLERGVRRALAFYPHVRLAWSECCWSDVIGARMARIAGRLQGQVADTSPRRMLDRLVPDALSYSSLYGELHDTVHLAYSELRTSMAAEGYPRAPVVLVSHSWGTVLASDWIYDRDCRGVAGLATLGSPLRWLLAKLPPDADLKPVTPPLWVNVWDAHDPISSPLRPIAPEYSAAVTEDVEVQNGSWWDRMRRFTSIPAHHDYAGTVAVHAAIAEVVNAAAALVTDSPITQ